MNYPGFCGGSAPSQSPIANSERTINLYVERMQAKASPTDALLLPTPGFEDYATTTDVGSRAFCYAAGRCFVVVGTGLWEIFSTGMATLRGTVAQDSHPATISYNGVAGGQLLITSGTNGYLFVLSTNTLTAIGALAGKATMGGMKDGRFLAFDIATATVYLSNLNDGSTWTTGTLFFQRSIAPDPWQAMIVGNPEIWMVGERTSEAWYNSGAFPQPFAPILSSFMQSGTNAPFSVAMAGDAPLWVQSTALGSATIVRVQGYTPQTISDYAVSTALSQYQRDATLDDAETVVYEQEGHTFAVVSFPTANATWAVDLETGDWHERGSWNSALNRYDVWQPRVHGYAFGQHLVGSRTTGVISRMDVTLGLEADGGPIRRLRIAPPLWASQQARLSVSRLGLFMDTGLGTLSGQGMNPSVMLRTSPNARTWSSERSCSAGAQGNYGTRVYWNRCGSSRQLWFPEIVVSDPVPWRIAGAEVDGSGIAKMGKAAA